ncbi:MAG: N-acetyltransferase [Acidobacteria bacterium]|nr:MAG: N-acetyltransferase [Acidobacteriota bacterium]
MGKMSEHLATAKIHVRRATLGDAERLAALATELGYPSTPEEVTSRLERIERDVGHFVGVAEFADGRVVGWIHVCVSYLIESNPRAEIGGLVVDEARRGSGVGKLLMQHAEDWARSKRLEAVYLRSNVIRKDAHRFYERLGYKNIKTQYAFSKML